MSRLTQKRQLRDYLPFRELLRQAHFIGRPAHAFAIKLSNELIDGLI
jgi:hypothetical protein